MGKLTWSRKYILIYTLKAWPRLEGVSPPTKVSSVRNATVCITLTAFNGNLNRRDQSSFYYIVTDTFHCGYSRLLNFPISINSYAHCQWPVAFSRISTHSTFQKTIFENKNKLSILSIFTSTVFAKIENIIPLFSQEMSSFQKITKISLKSYQANKFSEFFKNWIQKIDFIELLSNRANFWLTSHEQFLQRA